MKKCKDCGINHKEKTKLCEKCSKRARDTMIKRRNKRKSKKLCITCGKNPSTHNILRCTGCRDETNNKNLLRRKKYRSDGKCEKCGTKKNDVKVWYNVWCTYCHLKYKFKHTGTRIEATQIINTMLENQNYKCALTGRDLHNNKFHIDHIMPKSKGGSNTPNNWQLIVEEANVFKTDLSMEEIIKLAEDITKNFSPIY